MRIPDPNLCEVNDQSKNVYSIGHFNDIVDIAHARYLVTDMYGMTYRPIFSPCLQSSV